MDERVLIGRFWKKTDEICGCDCGYYSGTAGSGCGPGSGDTCGNNPDGNAGGDPLWKRGEDPKGYVIGLTDQPAVAENRMKEIRGVAAGGVGAESRLIALAGWIRENYGSTMIQALKTVLPVKEKIRAREEKTLTLLLSEEKAKEQLDFYRKKHQSARERLLGELMAEKQLDYKEAVQRLNLSASVVRAMEEQGVLQVRTRQISRTPLPEIETVQDPFFSRRSSSGWPERFWKNGKGREEPV